MNTAAILSILFLAQSAYIENPALTDFAYLYSEVSYSTVLLISTLTSLVVIPSTMLSGVITRRHIRYKN